MKSRVRGFAAAFAISLAMWVAIVYGSMSLLETGQPGVDRMTTASLN